MEWRTVHGAAWYKLAEIKKETPGPLRAAVERHPWSWTGTCKRTGETLVCCGILEGGIAWGVISAKLTHRGQTRTIVEAVRDVLATYARCEGIVPTATISPTDPKAIRWATSIGLEPTYERDDIWLSAPSL